MSRWNNNKCFCLYRLIHVSLCTIVIKTMSVWPLINNSVFPLTLFFRSYLCSNEIRVIHLIDGYFHFYRPQRSWGKVIFSEACVNNSVHGGSPGPHPGGQVEGSGQGDLQAHTWWGVGVFHHAMRQTPPHQQTATAADGTHPTGMHSCLSYGLRF